MSLMTRMLGAGAFGKDMAVDLGTANTLVYVKGEGIVLNEPSVVAVNTITNAIIAVGEEAKRMVGRTPAHIVAIRPLKDGVIADFDVTEKMLRYFIQKVHQRRALARPRMVVAVPSGITGVEQRAVEEAAVQAGARAAFIIEEPMAAAIGAGLPIHEPIGNMVVDVGGGTTEVAVISLGGIVTSQSIRVGGDEMDEAIINYIKRDYQLMIGERTSEVLKVNIGSAFPLGDDDQEDEIKGRDLASGLPKTVVVTAEEIRQAIEEPVSGGRTDGQRRARQDPAGAGERHHGTGDSDGRGRRTHARPRGQDSPRDRHAGPYGQGPPAVRRHGLGQVP